MSYLLQRFRAALDAEAELHAHREQHRPPQRSVA